MKPRRNFDTTTIVKTHRRKGKLVLSYVRRKLGYRPSGVGVSTFGGTYKGKNTNEKIKSWLNYIRDSE